MYDIIEQTTGSKLDLLQAATGRARNVLDFKFEDEQLNVVRAIGTQGQITLLQGGAGTSKSETEDAVVVHAVKAGLKVIVACPQNVIADNVVVSIQRVLNETIPNAKAARWVSQQSQIAHLVYLARGQTAFDYWRLPESTPEGLSEEAAEVADSISNIHKLINGTFDKRFKAVDYIPIHLFAAQEGVVDFTPQSSRRLFRTPAPMSRATIKAQLEAEMKVNVHGKPRNGDAENPVDVAATSIETLKKTRTDCESELKRLVDHLAAVKELAKFETEASSLEKKGKARATQEECDHTAHNGQRELPSKSSIKKKIRKQNGLIADLTSKINESEQDIALERAGKESASDSDESIGPMPFEDSLSDDEDLADDGMPKDSKSRENMRQRAMDTAAEKVLFPMKGLEAATILGSEDHSLRRRQILRGLCQKENIQGLDQEEIRSLSHHAKLVLADDLASSNIKVLVMTTFSLSDSAVQAFKPDLIITTEAQQSNILGAMYNFAFFPDARYLFSGDPLQEGVMPVDTYRNQAGKILQKDIISWLLDHGREPLKLKLGYRQDAALTNMISQCAYDSEITPAPSTLGLPTANLIRQFNVTALKLSNKIPCALIDIPETEGSRMDHSNSVYNPKSANHTIALALKLALLVGADKITLLTSYLAQCTLLGKIVDSIHELKGIKISTVRGYLSSQNDIVIYDHARSKSLGFTASARHWRVILTRCRHGLFLLLNRSQLMPDLAKLKLYTDLESYLKKEKLVCQWPFGKPQDFSSIFSTEISISTSAQIEAAPRIKAVREATEKYWDELQKKEAEAIEAGLVRPTFDQDILDLKRQEALEQGYGDDKPASEIVGEGSSSSEIANDGHISSEVANVVWEGSNQEWGGIERSKCCNKRVYRIWRPRSS